MSLRRLLATTALALGLLGSSAVAAEEPGTTVDTLTATVQATNIGVSGTATFTGAPAVEVATDATGDHVGNQTPAPTGTDLVSASIQALDAGTIRFEIEIGNLPPGGTREVINYNWPFTIIKGGSAINYQIQAHSAATGREVICSTGLFVCTGSPDNIGQPVFDLQTCTPNATGGQDCASQEVPGEMTDSSFIWSVPVTLLGAIGGGVTIEPNGNIAASRSASGVTWWTDGSAGDSMVWDGDPFTVPVPAVSLGVDVAETPDDGVELTKTIAAKSNGSFTTTVPRPSTAGSYRLVAQACFGPGNCGLASTLFTVP